MGEAKPELLPCPFCGGAPSHGKTMDEDIWSHNTVPWMRVRCSECEIGTDYVCEGYEPSEVEAWNRRSGQLVERVKELEELLRAYMAAYEMPKYGDWSKLPEPPPRTYDASYHGGDCSKHGRYYGRCHCCESDLEDARKALEREAKRAREMVFETADAAARAALSKARPNTAEGE